MTGRVGNLTPEQAEMLKKFKVELAIEGFFKVRLQRLSTPPLPRKFN